MPITSTATRGWAAIERTLKIAVGVSIIAQMRTDAGAPAASSCAATASTYVDRVDLRDHDRRRSGRAAAARSSAPHSVSSPLQRIVSSRLPYIAGLHRGDGLGPGVGLGVGGDGVLEVEDDRVGRDRLRLLEGALVGRRHVQHRAARAQVVDRSVVHDANP